MAVAVEESFQRLEAAQTRGAFQIQRGTVIREEFCGANASVGQTGIDQTPAVSAIERGSMLEEDFHQLLLVSSLLGMEAGGHQFKCGGEAAINAGRGIHIRASS